MLARKDPYIPFVWLGGIIVAIVQNEIIFRNAKESAESIEVVEKIGTLLNVICGVFILALPHLSLFYELVLRETDKSVQGLCLVIYTIWGMEKILMGLYHWRKVF